MRLIVAVRIIKKQVEPKIAYQSGKMKTLNALYFHGAAKDQLLRNIRPQLQIISKCLTEKKAVVQLHQPTRRLAMRATRSRGRKGQQRRRSSIQHKGVEGPFTLPFSFSLKRNLLMTRSIDCTTALRKYKKIITWKSFLLLFMSPRLMIVTSN